MTPSTRVNEYKARLIEQVDVLQSYMENNFHLDNPNTCEQLAYKILARSQFLSEEDKEYVQIALYAIEEQTEWKLDEEFDHE